MTATTLSENRELVGEYHEVVENQDVDRVPDFYADDCTVETEVSMQVHESCRIEDGEFVETHSTAGLTPLLGQFAVGSRSSSNPSCPFGPRHSRLVAASSPVGTGTDAGSDFRRRGNRTVLSVGAQARV